ncbi:MAG: ATP-binding cassette domain-containing protein [Actinobacteria bacterium]|nr:ATP-binding cassette domain-containing protein [Actinomycetota bacterium]
MSALLSLIGVTKRYARGVREVTVLDDVSLELEAGDFACVLAGRGEGKTTLLEIAAGYRWPEEGRVMFAGRDISTVNDRVRSRLHRSEIRCVLNRSVPVVRGETVLDHVALPLTADGAGVRAARHTAAAMIERVGAREYIDARVTDLADWERARVALAQACVPGPRLLIADELTDTLDLIERSSVLALLQSFAREGVAVLITAADAHGAVGCSRLLTLSGAELVEAPVTRTEGEKPSNDPGEVVPFTRERRGGGGE